MSEVVVGVVAYSEGAKIKLGSLPMKCALIFTTNRLIIAKLAGFLTMLTPIFPVVGSMVANLSTKNPSELAKLKPDDILKSDKNNYSMTYSDIKKVQMAYSTFPDERWGVLIWMSKDRYNFIFNNRADFVNVLDLVKRTMPQVDLILPKKW